MESVKILLAPGQVLLSILSAAILNVPQATADSKAEPAQARFPEQPLPAGEDLVAAEGRLSVEAAAAAVVAFMVVVAEGGANPMMNGGNIDA